MSLKGISTFDTKYKEVFPLYRNGFLKPKDIVVNNIISAIDCSIYVITSVISPTRFRGRYIGQLK